jgi:hypothetical protein
MVIEFISLLLTVFSNSFTRNKFFNCPELTGALAPFSFLVIISEPIYNITLSIMASA